MAMYNILLALVLQHLLRVSTMMWLKISFFFWVFQLCAHNNKIT